MPFKKWVKVLQNGGISVTLCCKNYVSMFIGSHTCKLDDKGRVPFPAAFRAAAVSGDGQVRLVVQREPAVKYLTIMTKTVCEREIEFLEKSLDPYDDEQQLLIDSLFQNMDSLDVDAAGRILLPKRFIEKAGISKDVIFVGEGSKIKLWDKATYDSGVMSDEEAAALRRKYLRRKEQ
jgi:MraZ protein